MFKKIIIILTLVFIFPIDVLAGGNDSDLTFTTTFEDGYTYGNVSKCSDRYGTEIVTVDGYKLCIKKVGSDYFPDTLVCENKEMESFKIDINGSNNETYSGYGCRKPNNDNKINYVEKKILVGTEQFLLEKSTDQFLYNCTILSDDADATIENCYLKVKKEGSVKLKVVNKDNFQTLYYKYNVSKPYDKISQLDSNYIYGNIKKCDLRSGGYNIGNIVNFDGYDFCASKVENFTVSSLSCLNEDYDTFPVTFAIDDDVYYGYGCRKVKKEENIEYKPLQLKVGEKYDFSNSTEYKCSVVSGTSGYFDLNSWYPCRFIAIKEGITKVKIKNNKTNISEYYEIKVGLDDENSEAIDSTNYEKLMCDLKAILSNKNVDLSTLPNIKLRGEDINIGNLNCNSSVSCEEENCNYVLENKLKEIQNYCNSIYTLNAEDNKSRFDECISFDDFYKALVEENLVDDLANYCGMLSEDLVAKIKFILDIVKFVAPLIAIVLGTLDFVKVIVNGDADKEMKSAFKRFSIRIAAAVLLFIIPIILAFLMDIFLGNKDGYDSDNPFCNIVDWNE